MKIESTSTLLKKEQIHKVLSISARTLENLVHDGAFPPAVRLGKWCYWSQKVIAVWVQRQFAVQETWSPSCGARAGAG